MRVDLQDLGVPTNKMHRFEYEEVILIVLVHNSVGCLKTAVFPYSFQSGFKNICPASQQQTVQSRWQLFRAVCV